MYYFFTFQTICESTKKNGLRDQKKMKKIQASVPFLENIQAHKPLKLSLTNSLINNIHCFKKRQDLKNKNATIQLLNENQSQQHEKTTTYYCLYIRSRERRGTPKIHLFIHWRRNGTSSHFKRRI